MAFAATAAGTSQVTAMAAFAATAAVTTTATGTSQVTAMTAFAATAAVTHVTATAAFTQLPP